MKPKIIAYLKPQCGWSKGVRAIFQKYNLSYEDRDIINNESQFHEMVEKSGQTLSPCLEINGKMLADVSGDEVEEFLLKKNYINKSNTITSVPTDSACEGH